MGEPSDIAARFQNLATRLLRQARLREDGSELTSAQYSAISSLYNHPDLPLTELARLESVSHPTMSRLVTALIDQGLVVRSADVRDKRSTRLNLTDNGREAYRSVYGKRLALIGGLLAQLKPETIADILQALETLPALSGPPPLDRP